MLARKSRLTNRKFYVSSFYSKIIVDALSWKVLHETTAKLNGRL